MKYYDGQLSADVASNPQKYIQIKAILYSFDNMSTPRIDNYSLDYYFDVDPPDNPTLTQRLL